VGIALGDIDVGHDVLRSLGAASLRTV
jgi:hypothetical protein